MPKIDTFVGNMTRNCTHATLQPGNIRKLRAVSRYLGFFFIGLDSAVVSGDDGILQPQHKQRVRSRKHYNHAVYASTTLGRTTQWILFGFFFGSFLTKL
jgi:hypothetical protein